jgi:hypothetical protein
MAGSNEGWTPEALVAEGKQLINQYNQTSDPRKKSEIDGCFIAVQEVLLAHNDKNREVVE